MSNQKGQIHIIILVLVVVGFILYLNFSNRSLLTSIFQPTITKSTPKQRTTISIPPSSPAPAAPVPTAPEPAPSALPPEDKIPPVISNPSHQGDILPAETKEVVISVSTDEPAYCKYTANPEKSSYSQMSWYDQTKRFHVKTITGLKNSMSYEFFVHCQDLKGNSTTGYVMISFSIQQ